MESESTMIQLGRPNTTNLQPSSLQTDIFGTFRFFQPERLAIFENNFFLGEVLPPNETDVPVGRIKRLLKSNSLTALANINFGWRKETSV